MLAPNQQEKPAAPIRELPGKRGLRGNQADGDRALSATQDAKVWFILLKGHRYGPCTFTALVHMAEIGVVDAETGVWCVGWAKWRTAGSIPELPKRESNDLNEVDERADKATGHQAPYSGRATTEKTGTTALPLDQAASQNPAPSHQSKRGNPGGRARLAILCVLAVIIITFGVGWAAISLEIIRVKLMPPGAELLKQVEATLAGTGTPH